MLKNTSKHTWKMYNLFTINPKRDSHVFTFFILPTMRFNIAINSKYKYQSYFTVAFLFFQFSLVYTRIKNIQ